MVKKTPPILHRKMNQRRDDDEALLRVYDHTNAEEIGAQFCCRCWVIQREVNDDNRP